MENIDYDYVEQATTAAKKAAGTATGMSDVILYVYMGVTAAILLACIILIIILLVKVSVMEKSMLSAINASNAHSQFGDFSKGIGCVFCPSCGNQYDASEKMCPYCKTKKPV